MLEFEHTIFILLLLSGILNTKPSQKRWAIFVILVGILLVFLPPANEIPVPWEMILGLVIPLLLYQNFRRLVISNWQGWGSLFLWGITALAFSVVLWLVGALNLPGSLLFGLIVASMIWRAGEPENEASYVGQMGSLTLIFMLTEVETAIQIPNHYIGGIFSAAFLGLLTAFLGINLLRKVPPRFYSLISIGQVYFAYWFTFFIGKSSPVTAALVSVMAFVWLNQYSRIGVSMKSLPMPLDTWPGFSFVLVLFLLLGWQAHQPASVLLFLEVIVGSLLGLCFAWLGHKYKTLTFQKESPFWLTGQRVAALLFPALLIWPRDILRNPIQLAAAIGISILVISIPHLGHSIFFPGGSHLKNIRP